MEEIFTKIKIVINEYNTYPYGKGKKRERKPKSMVLQLDLKPSEND